MTSSFSDPSAMETSPAIAALTVSEAIVPLSMWTLSFDIVEATSIFNAPASRPAIVSSTLPPLSAVTDNVSGPERLPRSKPSEWSLAMMPVSSACGL